MTEATRPAPAAGPPAAPLRLGVVTDLHVAVSATADGHWNNPVLLRESAELLDRAVDGMRAAGVHQVLVLGDVTDRGDAESARAAVRALAATGVPVWVVPGNHDVSASPDVLAAAAGPGTGAAVPTAGPQPLAAGIDLCGVGVRSHDAGATCESTAAPEPERSAAALLVCATHYPPLSVKPQLHARGLRYPGDLRDRRRLQRALLARTAPSVALHGHVHAAVQLAHGPLLQIGCPSLAEWPHAWTLVTLTAGGDDVTVDVERRAVRPGPPPVADTTFCPDRTRWRGGGDGWRPTEPVAPAEVAR